MTQQEAAKYARQCRKAKALSLPKPQRPDTTQIAELEATARNAKKSKQVIEYRLKIITQQSMYIMDFFDTIAREHPELRVHQLIQDAICNSLYELQDVLKSL